jgi:hypothetical protein
MSRRRADRQKTKTLAQRMQLLHGLQIDRDLVILEGMLSLGLRASRAVFTEQ